MADKYAICLLGAMDRLWFHQIILFSEPISLLFPKTRETPPESLTSSSSSISQASLPEDKISSAITLPQVDYDNEDDQKERATRLNMNLIKIKSRSLSSSPVTTTHEKRSKSRRLRYSSRLEKTMSCKSLWELELEEVKGFMDLGFIFNKEHLNPRMMSLVPGLQRINGSHKSSSTDQLVAKDEEIEIEEEEEKRGVMRPYLSEAWLINKPNSPLLNLRVPRVSATADMKKLLRNWATTVASVIHQES